MSDTRVTQDRILDVAESVLRRYGPQKATVVDVARALGVSHGSIHRHFGTKAALREAVVKRWLESVTQPLRSIREGKQPAPERLWQWHKELSSAKRRLLQEDPELFATYYVLATEAREVVEAHENELIGQIGDIIEDGVTEGTLHAGDPRGMAHAVFDATVRFHHPAHSQEWERSDIDEAFDAVLHMVLTALGSP